MGEVETINKNEVATQDDIISALKNSLYPGAKDESIHMVLSYCKAAKLDPMQKPVHIVPMSVKTQSGYEYRDIIMPGIGLYRIQAARSGDYAGVSEPEFGPDVESVLKNKAGKESLFKHPEWCRITAKKIVSGHICEFTAREYWLENYATDSNKSTAPNSMWRKRPKGQLAKCTSAQALRIGWPEIGSQPTAEEMEGKQLEGPVIEAQAEETTALTLEEVLQKIDAAKSTGELEKVVPLAAKLNEEDSAKAMAAGSNRFKELSNVIEGDWS